MSRFIKYASNILDGVDSMAKDSLTDQDIAAAAAERRRRRRQLKKDSFSQRGGSAAEPSEGDLSGDSSQLDTPGPAGRRVRAFSGVSSTGSGPHARHGMRLQYSGSFDEAGSTVEEGEHDGGGESEGQQHRPWSSAASPAAPSITSAPSTGASPAPPSKIGTSSTVTPASKSSAPVTAAAGSAGEGEAGVAAVTGGYPSSAGEEDNSPAATAAAASVAAPSTAGGSSAVPRHPHSNPREHRYLREMTGMVAEGGGAPGKEDGSVWSDKDTISSAAPSPLGRGHAAYGAPHSHGSDGGVEGSIPPQTQEERPSPLEGGLVVGGAAAGAVAGEGGAGGDGDGEEDAEERRVRAASIMASNVSMHVNVSLSPTRERLGRQKREPQQGHPREDEHAGGSGDGAGHGAERGGGGGSRRGVDGTRLRAPSPPGEASSSAAIGGGGGGRAGGRERRGFGGLLGMGGGRKGRGDDDDVEALRAEAEELRAEVEELSLELEDAEDRLNGQEAELRTSAEKLKRQKAAAAEREREIEAEMEEFRTLQLDEKKVFLANLEGVERKLKEKERDAEEARSALAALEAFAMEREDAATRLAHEKEELLEELKGARSGQDRSAEEVREALARAEAEAEEVETRHRSWMRQAQARQTELEATAAQLAAALAEANRKQQQQQQQSAAAEEEADGEGARLGGGQGRSGGGTRTADRELRALGDELESCQASLELEQERTRSLQQEVSALRHDLDAARASEAVAERQRQEHAKMAADSFAKASRLEQQLQQEKASAKHLGASVPPPSGPESQIQALSSKLLDKQARLEESVRARTTLTAKLKEASDRAFRAEQELRESRGEFLEAGGGAGGGGGGPGMMRSRRGRQDRSSLGGGRGSPTGTWSRLAPIAKHKKIATAVDVLDRQTLQGVVFLRNSSVARAAFLAYLLLLHLWAFAVVSFHSSTIDHTKHPAEFSGNANHGHD